MLCWEKEDSGMKTTTRAGQRGKLGWVLSLWLTASAVSMWSLGAPAHAQLLPGDSLVIHSDAGTNGQGALFRVSPATGTRLLLSDFGTGANLGVDPLGVAVEAAGTILVIDQNAGTNFRGALFRVDPSTGTRTLLSDFGTGANLGSEPAGVAVTRVAQRVNSRLTFVPLSNTYTTTANTSGCPAGVTGGKFSFSARLTNANAPGVLGSLVVEVQSLSNGNLLQNAQGGPGGVGACLVVPLVGSFADGRLGNSEQVDVPFVICLTNTNQFSFFVNVLGVAQ
jgi:hypothetical protein